MDDGWNVIFGVALLAGAAYLFGTDMMIYSSNDRINVYLVDIKNCVTDSKSPEFCNATRFGIFKMSVDKNTSRVNTKADISSDISKLLTADESSEISLIGIGSLENCKIFDKNNWSCGTTAMTNGFLYSDGLNGQNNSKFESVYGWQYRLLGFGVPLLLFGQT